MSRSVRWSLAAAIAFVIALVGGAHIRQGSAAPLEATWSMYSRADSTPFSVGAPGATGGYEIVSFAAAGPSSALETYVYGGPDLSPPLPQLVACGAAMQPTALDLAVANGYPYAGCVYFLGVTNSGTDPIRVDLGLLEANATVACNVAGCGRGDLDIVAGGRTAAEIGQLCSGPASQVAGGPLLYAIAPGDTFVCPLFIVVLQPAKESASYRIVIVPPTPESSEVPITAKTPTPTFAPRSGSALVTPTPPVAAGRATPSPSPARTEVVAGARTAGASVTPVAPASGSGKLVQRRGGGRAPWLLIVLCGGLAAGLVLAWPARR